jgi:hypothetical protein
MESIVTEFDETARKKCRNPKCRMKLPATVANSREAFCARGCHTSFYRTHCRVCEDPIKQPDRGGRLICKKAACRNAWKAGSGFGRYHIAPSAKSSSETPTKPGIAEPHKAKRTWLIVAGPKLSSNQLRVATIRDGGEQQRIEAKNRAALMACKHAEIEANGEFSESDCREIVSLDGVLCFASRFREALNKRSHLVPPQPDDLSIPTFLDRRPQPEAQLRFAA